MDYALVCAVALLASGLTFFSGFGLGTLLMPAFAIFFPLEIAIAATAVVHFVNNLFKLALTARSAHARTLLGFLPAALVAALLGAWLLSSLGHAAPLTTYTLAGGEHSISPVKAAIASVIFLFSVIEFLPAFDRLAFDRRWLPIGGAVSGFFGGLSGHQGALRAAFLIRCGLTKEQFIATGIVCSCAVDFSRLGVYSLQIRSSHEHIPWPLVAAASAAALAGTLLGSRLVRKVTIRSVRLIVAVALGLFAIALGFGLV
ncbi:MAG: sulfite exporter TauE/SafE family protein [Leptolyngbya sp. PLA1]|nr:sulfite exporter TauE/SafE family protein [Leptolyngbya sp. PLA1]